MSDLPSVEQVKAMIAQHELTRPDMIASIHPNAPKHVRDNYDKWMNYHRHLKTLLSMAQSEAENHWRDKDGNIVDPPQWDKPQGGVVNIHGIKTHAQRVKDALKKANGRPRSENPTPEALWCRKKREEAKRREALCASSEKS